MFFFLVIPLGLIFFLIEGIAAISLAVLLYLGFLVVFLAAVGAVLQAGYGWVFLALFGALFVVGCVIKAVGYFWPPLTGETLIYRPRRFPGSDSDRQERTVPYVTPDGAIAFRHEVESPPQNPRRPSRVRQVVTSAVVIVLGLVVPPLVIGILAFAAADCFKTRDYRNGVGAVFLGFLLVVLCYAH